MSDRKRIVISPTEQLQRLWQEGFFTTWKKFPEIDSELATKGYHFPSGDLAKALIRATYLTRRGKKGGYEYIQKGPFAAHATTN